MPILKEVPGYSDVYDEDDHYLPGEMMLKFVNLDWDEEHRLAPVLTHEQCLVIQGLAGEVASRQLKLPPAPACAAAS